MNNASSCMIFFLAGLVIGGAGGWLLTKSKYQKLADEEIAEIRDIYLNEAKALNEKAKETESNAKDQSYYNGLINKLNYSTLSDPSRATSEACADDSRYDEKEKKAIEEVNDEIEAQLLADNYEEDYEYNDLIGHDFDPITPEEWESGMEYEKLTWIYYSGDDTIADVDDHGRVIHNGLEIIGQENLDLIGYYEEGVVYIRDNESMTDIQVLYDEDPYEDD